MNTMTESPHSMKTSREFRPAWVLQLTNAQLIDAFGEAYEARETRDDAPDLMRRLDVPARRDFQTV
jgi:hypothetical protein